MEYRRIGALAFIIGVVAQALQAVPALIVSNWLNNGIQIPQWAPTFGTAGQTVVVYQIVTEIRGDRRRWSDRRTSSNSPNRLDVCLIAGSDAFLSTTVYVPGVFEER